MMDGLGDIVVDLETFENLFIIDGTYVWWWMDNLWIYVMMDGFVMMDGSMWYICVDG